MSTTSAQPRHPLSTSTQSSDPLTEQSIHQTGSDRTESLEDTFSPFSTSHDASRPAFTYNASLHILDTSTPQAHPTITTPSFQTPQSAGLRVQTGVPSPRPFGNERPSSEPFPQIEDTSQNIVANAGLPVRSSSVRSALSTTRSRVNSLSPGSAVSSPGVGPLVDITPLPSPLSISFPSAPWRRGAEGDSEPPTSPPKITMSSMASPAEPIVFARTSPKKRRFPIGLPLTDSGPYGIDSQISAHHAMSHSRNRSLSEYTPESMQTSRPRNVVVSGSMMPPTLEPQSPPLDHLHREQYLAVQRGITVPVAKPPSPPRSSRETDSSDQESPPASPRIVSSLPLRYEATMIRSGQPQKWRAVRQLGKGTFSTVMLATTSDADNEDLVKNVDVMVEQSISEEQNLHVKSLVAIKICEHGPAGGADEKKIEVSLRRELDILKSIEHPSLVHLKAVNRMEQRALLVLNYCAGGDLFDLAVSKPDALMPGLIRRIFAELVAALQYLHMQYIVHRDIKLENILVNLPTDELSTIEDWQSYPYPIVTLTDLGLGRWIPKPPESPLLDTKCGSEDYAAPELLMGQEYDGRSTDVWALGVTLYSIMEGRLPFDPIPGARRKSPPKHRIARCEWSWVKYADADGEWDPVRGRELEGARDVVEGLLARLRSRWSLEKVEQTEWVRGAIQVDGGLRRIEDEDEL